MIGQTLTHYKIVKKIGQGGMGEVYLAEDLNLGRTAALKILPPDVASDENRMRRFIQEAKTASSLKHPNVVAIYEIGESGETRFIAMEYIEGQTLESKIDKHPLPADEILNISVQIADALDEAHAQGIIHRDIKAANIMITPRGQVKILDFGLSKVAPVTASQDASRFETQAKTQPGMVMGTIQYMSPEQALGREVDQRSDIFSLGIVLYQMATGTLPFIGSTPTETMNLIVNAPPEAPARFNYNLSPDLERIIRKCLEKEPERRYQSGRDLLVDLKNLKRDTESGPSGVKPVVRAGKRSVPLPLIVAVLGLVLALAGFLLYKNFADHSVIHSIAVLPFLNTTADPKTEYLSDGITESTINSLSQLPNIKVMARSTVFQFKRQQLDPIKIGRDLKVDAVLTGTMNNHDQQLLVSTELVNVSDGSQIWGQQYNRPISDLLSLQKDIAGQISEQLRLKLTGEQKKQLSKNYPTNSEAYQLYLQGRYQWNKRSDEGYRKAIDFFQQAIEKDPTYARAYAGLADCYSTDSSPFPQAERLPKAKAAAMRAIEIDPNLAEAHSSLGAVRTSLWEWTEGEKELRRAIELNPNYATGHQWYAEYLLQMRQFDKAFTEIKKAMELDPLSLIINSTYGWLLLYSGQYDRSLQQARRVLDMDPKFGPARRVEFETLVALRKYDELLDVLEKRGPSAAEQAGLNEAKQAYQTGGERALLEFALQATTADFERGEELPYNVAVIHMQLGNKDKAIEWLEKAYQQRDAILLPILAADPRFEKLRSDPRFQDLLRRIGLPVVK